MTIEMALRLQSSISLSLAIVVRLASHRLTVLVMACLLAFVAQGQTTSLRQAQIYEGEIAELTIEYEASIPSLYAIDTSILETDFEILGKRSKVSRVPGANPIRHRMQWSVELLPRRAGKLQIPALQYGDNFTEPMLLEVNRASTSQLTQTKVFIEVEIHPGNPYPGQQTRLVTRLFHNLELHDGTFEEPDSGDLQVYRIGRKAHYEIERNGVKFNVAEHSLLLTPMSSAVLAIGSATYRGSIHLSDVHFSNGIETADAIRYIYRRSNAVILQPRALPPGYSADTLLPALDLKMWIDWDDINANLRPGDSLGFTLNLQATGLPGEALPADLLIREHSGYSVYADQETRTTEIKGEPDYEQLSGRLEQRYAIIIERSGEITLPALELRWWDLNQDVERIASLSATRLTITAAESTTETLSNSGNPEVHRLLEENSQGAPGGMPGEMIDQLHAYWPWLAALALGISVLGLLMPGFLKSRFPLFPGKLYGLIAGKLKQLSERRQCLDNLRRACQVNDAVAARGELLEWARSHCCDDRIHGLRQLASRIGSRPGVQQWRTELAQLDAAAYGIETGDWQGQALWKLVRQARKMKSQSGRIYGIRPRRSLRLPKLYPRTKINQAC